MSSRALSLAPHIPLIDAAIPGAPAPAADQRRRDALFVAGGTVLIVALLALRAVTLRAVALPAEPTLNVAGRTLSVVPLAATALVLVGALGLAGSGTVSRVREAALVAAGVLLLALSARVAFYLPGNPLVPVTGQTFAVLLIGAAYGWRRGFATVLAYILAGASGLPVFAATLGAATYGYLVGFALAALAVGWLAERGWGRTLPTAIAAMLVGEVAIYACALPWLASLIGWEKAKLFGLDPFIAGDAIKLLAAALVLPGAWWLVRRATRPEA